MNADLFESAEKAGDWFVLTNRLSLLHHLAAYAILPHSLIPEFGDPISAAARDQLVCFRRQVPATMWRAVAGAASEQFPVLLKLDGRRSNLSRITRLSSTESGSEIGLIPGPLPLSVVQEICFRTKLDLEDFQSRVFDDIDLTCRPLVANAELFEALSTAPTSPFSGDSIGEHSSNGPPKLDRWALSDAFFGGVASLLRALPPGLEWLAAISSTLGGKSAVHPPVNLVGLFDCLRSGRSSTGSYDWHLIHAFCAAMMQPEFRSGWVPTRILQSVERSLTTGSGTLQGPDRIRFEKWQRNVLGVLADTEDVPHLVDGSDWVMHGILLALMKETPDAVVGSGDAYYRPGTDVRALAALLTGFHCGFRALSAKEKRPLVLAEHIAGLCCAESYDSRPVPWQTNAVTLECRPVSPLQNILVLKIGDQTVVEKVGEPDPALRTVIALAERIGIQLQDGGEPSSLRCIWERSKGERQEIIFRLLPNTAGKAIVRFAAPCASLKSLLEDQPRGLEDTLRGSKSKLVDRNAPLDLILQQSQPNVHCRFVFDGVSQSIEAVADQILETMDTAEFRSHIEQVADAAADYQMRKATARRGHTKNKTDDSN